MARSDLLRVVHHEYDTVPKPHVGMVLGFWLSSNGHKLTEQDRQALADQVCQKLTEQSPEHLKKPEAKLLTTDDPTDLELSLLVYVSNEFDEQDVPGLVQSTHRVVEAVAANILSKYPPKK
ncbi:MAG TPA: hypothetical protein VD907_03850 [Verrucomicrobiae bacterium]|nr:hypothetical protein [Verrucomicrobiae bacterium]